GLQRIQRRSRLPVVLTTDEVRRVLGSMHGTTKLIAELLYGAGLRVTECMTLRVKDLDLQAGTINIRAGKGGSDRASLLPGALLQPLQQQLLRVAALHKR